MIKVCILRSIYYNKIKMADFTKGSFIHLFYTRLEDDNIMHTNHPEVPLIIYTINLHTEHS
jgi:hypothetical protein